MSLLELHSRFISSITMVKREDWQTLAKDAGPFLDYDFLLSLEQSGCVGNGTGWQPRHVIVEYLGQLVAAMPGYSKYHSYGEYVFDHAWANAYAQHGLDYFPKWISAIPFTPVTGARLLTDGSVAVDIACKHIVELLSTLEANEHSSLHVLFPSSESITPFLKQGFVTRHSVQFQWHNYHYETFDDFLHTLTSRKRKSIKRARDGLLQQGVETRILVGNDIGDSEWTFFVRCYQQTYLKRSGHNGYLTADFFTRIRNLLLDKIMLVMAYEHGIPVASALFFYDVSGLYGRYWGAIKEIDQLHFECCYYQGIAFAIAHQLPVFNPGTQGEHKLLRGFEPIYCLSLHKLFHHEFHQAVCDFLSRETPAVMNYYHQALAVLPFNQENLPRLSVYNQPYTPERLGQR